ncbi:hypothetical protein ACFGVS_18375 [Mucilaginibacter sp. AW1-7]|uniref:hypothetical protein n=1 Tax=Mucilaginibacter sp. AW1-7 TaxID=3349874 RepID=UPI003F741B58
MKLVVKHRAAMAKSASAAAARVSLVAFMQIATLICSINQKSIPQPTLVMAVDTGLAPNAMCAYERTARAAGNDILNSKVKIQKSKKGIGH